MAEDDEDADTTLNEFFRKYEHLFVITGVFAALAVYLLRTRESPNIGNPEFIGIGIFSAFSIVVMTSTLVVVYGVSEFSPEKLSEMIDINERLVRFGFLVVFLGLMYFIIYSIATVAISQKSGFLYFMGVVSWLAISAISAYILFLILDTLFETTDYGIQAGIVIEIYLLTILLLALFATGYLNTRFGVSAGDVTSASVYQSSLKNLAAVISFSTTATSVITGLFLILSTSTLVNMVLTRIWTAFEKKAGEKVNNDNE